jgi:hypothetical protein
MYELDLDGPIDGNYFDNNNYEIPSFDFKEETHSNKEDYSFILEEKNNLYCLEPQQPIGHAGNEIQFNSNQKRMTDKPAKEMNLIKNSRTKTTNDITLLPNKSLKRKEKIFGIQIVGKNLLGRKRIGQDYSKENIHTKYGDDNIRNKVKRNYHNNYLKNLNLQLSKSKNPNLNKIELKKIDNSTIIVSKKEENLELLDKKIKDTLSSKISSRYLYLKEDYNKKQIEFIMQQNDKDINYALNLTNREVLDIYCNNKKDNPFFKGFKTLDDDLEKLKNKGNDSSYIKLYKYTAKNFEQIVNDKEPRRKRKKASK